MDTGFLFTLTLIRNADETTSEYQLQAGMESHYSAFVVASELARARGKRAGVAVHCLLPLPRHSRRWLLTLLYGRRNRERWNADKSRPPVCLSTADGMTVSTGLELGADSDNTPAVSR